MRALSGDHPFLDTLVRIGLVGAVLAAMFVMRRDAGGEPPRSPLPRHRAPPEDPLITKEDDGEERTITISLTRLDPDDPDRARTRIRCRDRVWLLPVSNWRGRGHEGEDAALDAARDHVFSLVLFRVQRLHADFPYFPGVIASPHPDGDSVPHADVMGILDVFRGAGIDDVLFEGRQMPHLKR